MREGGSIGFSFSNTANVNYANIGASISLTGQKLAGYRGSSNKADLSYTVAERKSFVDNNLDATPPDLSDLVKTGDTV